MIEEIKSKTIPLEGVPFWRGGGMQKGWWDTNSSNFLQNVLSYFSLWRIFAYAQFQTSTMILHIIICANEASARQLTLLMIPSKVSVSWV